MILYGNPWQVFCLSRFWQYFCVIKTANLTTTSADSSRARKFDLKTVEHIISIPIFLFSVTLTDVYPFLQSV